MFIFRSSEPAIFPSLSLSLSLSLLPLSYAKKFFLPFIFNRLKNKKNIFATTCWSSCGERWKFALGNMCSIRLSCIYKKKFSHPSYPSVRKWWRQQRRNNSRSQGGIGNKSHCRLHSHLTVRGRNVGEIGCLLWTKRCSHLQIFRNLSSEEIPPSPCDLFTVFCHFSPGETFDSGESPRSRRDIVLLFRNIE